MARYLIKILIFLLPLSVFAQQNTFDWAEKCGNPPNTTDTKTSMASDHEGGFVMAGEFLDQAKFGNEILNSSGGTDIFLAYYTQSGDVTSALKIGASDYEFIQDVMMDDEGNTFILGYFYGTTQIGSNQFSSYGSQDVFIAKIDDVGKVAWSLQVGGIMADYPTGIELDQYGNIYITGYFYDEIILGDTTLLSSDGSDIYLAKFDANGLYTDVFQAGGSSSDQVRSITTDNNNKLVITGSFYDDITIADTTLTTSDPVGVFITKLDDLLQFEWAFQLSGTYLNTELYAEADHIGNFYLGGSFSEDVFFGNQTFSAGEFNQDVYLAKYDASSNLLWARHGQGIGSDQVVSLGVDDNNNVYMTGHFLDTLHFEGITIPYTLCCGSREIYIINYTHDGRPWWGEQVSGARTSLHSMTMNTANQLMMSGHFTEDLVIGQWTLSSLDGFVNFVTCLTGDIYTGIYQPAPTISFNSYPNPAKDVIFFDSQEKIMRIEVFNVQGTSCLTEESENVKQLRLEDLVPGTYFLRFTTANGETGIGKIVVVD